MIFFFTRRAKIKKFGIFRGNFPNPNLRWQIQSEKQKFDPNPSLVKYQRLTGFNKTKD